MFIHLAFICVANLGGNSILIVAPGLRTSLPTAAVFAILIAYSVIATVLASNAYVINIKKALKRQSRTAEKASISSEENSDKIKQLQAKINTLEIALKDALTKK